MVGYFALEAEPTEPAVRQVQVDFLPQPPFRSYPEAVTDNQHPDYQLGIDRRSANGAVERCQLPPQAIEFDEPVIDRSRCLSGTCRSSENS
jgi:hypothetical protein